MERWMQAAIREKKERAAMLVRYANPKSRSKPTLEEVTAALELHIPYAGTVRPEIVTLTVTRYSINRLLRCAEFTLELSDSRTIRIDVYDHLTGRTPEEKEADKKATFPSGLFRIFSTDITPAKKPEPTPPEEPEKKKEGETMKRYELMPNNGRKSFYGKAVVEVEDNGTETLYSYHTPIIRRDSGGELVKLWDGWSATTGRHIAAFCGIGKADYMNLKGAQ